MKNITITTAKELKALVTTNRANIAAINGIQFGTMYPLINCSNKHASYYDVDTQGNKFLTSPFNVTLR